MLLRDCNLKDPSITEIFIVREGRVADAAINGRDRLTQAILPLANTMLKIKGARLDKVLDDDQVMSIIATLGVGVDLGGDPNLLDLRKVRYGKIILVLDDAPEGRHLREQVLAFMRRFMRPLLASGCVYELSIPDGEMSESELAERVLNSAAGEPVRK